MHRSRDPCMHGSPGGCMHPPVIDSPPHVRRARIAHAFRARGGRAALIAAVARERALASRAARRRRARTTRSRSRRRTSPARCTWGTRSTASIQDALVRHQRMRGQAHEVDLRHRPREHRDAAPGRARARAAGDEPRGARPRGVPRADLELARALRGDDRRAVQAPRRVVRLRRRALHARRALRRRRARRCSSRSTSAA